MGTLFFRFVMAVLYSWGALMLLTGYWTLTEVGQDARATSEEDRQGTEMTPLNGTKTHPLSAHAITELRNIARSPEPTVGVNPGVINRLMRENLVEIVRLPSPFKTHKAKAIDHLQITDAGRERLTAL